MVSIIDKKFKKKSIRTSERDFYLLNCTKVMKYLIPNQSLQGLPKLHNCDLANSRIEVVLPYSKLWLHRVL